MALVYFLYYCFTKVVRMKYLLMILLLTITVIIQDDNLFIKDDDTQLLTIKLTDRVLVLGGSDISLTIDEDKVVIK